MALTILVLIYDANILFAQTATVSTFAGSGVAGSADGTGSFATFTFPYGIAVDASGSIYIGDTGNNKIRKITSTGVVSTFTGTGTGSSVDGISSVASFSSPMGLAINASGYICHRL